MPRLPVLHRHAAALGLALATCSLAGCGQTGNLFLRMPDVEFPPQAPIIIGTPTTIFLPAGVTLPAPVSATKPAAAAVTHAAPAAVTGKAPAAASTSTPPAAITRP
jgi:hypothetical protein